MQLGGDARLARWLIAIAAACALAPLAVSWADEVFGRLQHPCFAGDFALLELAVRKATRGEQLLGPYSRFGWTHPGPLYFYFIVPFYRALHESSAALYLAPATLSVLCGAAVVALGARMVRSPLLRALGLALLMLAVRGFIHDDYEVGPSSPWNPSVTVLPFLLLVVLAARCALPGGRGFPALFVLHAFVSQTHVGNAPLATTAVASALLLRACDARRAPRHATRRMRAAVRRDLFVSPLVFFACWAPALIERHNLRALYEFFREPRDLHPFLHTVGYADRRIVGPHLPQLSIRNGLNVLAWIEVALVVAAVVRWKRDRTGVARLCAIVAIVGPACFFTASRIQDDLFPHVTPTFVLMLPLSVAALLFAALPQRSQPSRARWPRASVAAALGVALTAPFVARDLRAERARPEAMAALPPPEAIDAVAIAAEVRARTQPGRAVLSTRGDTWAVLAGVVLALDKSGHAPMVSSALHPIFHESVRYGDAPVQVVIDAGDARDLQTWYRSQVSVAGTYDSHPRTAPVRLVAAEHVMGDPSRLTDGVSAIDSAFDAPSSVHVEADARVTIEIGGRGSVRGVRVVADNNDEYLLETSRDGVLFGEEATLRTATRRGMQPRDVYFSPRAAIRFARISPKRGDGQYAISEIAAILDPRVVDSIVLGNDAARTRLLSGWSIDERNAEGGFVWVDAPSARCVLHLAEQRPHRLRIYGHPLVVPDRTQTMTVSAGDVQLASFTMSPERDAYDVVVPAHAAHAATELTFRFGYAIAPRSFVPTSDDARTLAAELEAIEVTREDDEPSSGT